MTSNVSSSWEIGWVGRWRRPMLRFQRPRRTVCVEFHVNEYMLRARLCCTHAFPAAFVLLGAVGAGEVFKTIGALQNARSASDGRYLPGCDANQLRAQWGGSCDPLLLERLVGVLVDVGGLGASVAEPQRDPGDVDDAY